MSALSRELRETLDDPKRYDWGGPWEHIGDAERDVRALLDELDTIEEALGQALDQAAVLHAALARVIDIATRGVGPDTTAEEVNSTIAAYVVKRLSRPETLGTYEPTTEERIDALTEQVQEPLVWMLGSLRPGVMFHSRNGMLALNELVLLAHELAAENARLRQPRQDDTWMHTSAGRQP